MEINSLKSDFLLDSEITYLNHGAYGAVPREVYQVYQNWQAEQEREPVDFLSRRSTERLAHARNELAKYLGTQRDNLVFATNGTTALNMLARSLVENLGTGDQLLTTNHEHGGINRMWQYFAEKYKFDYSQVSIPVPVDTHENFLDRFLDHVNPKTKLIFISHISSPSALIFPVKEICKFARERGIICVVDGSHAPGQIPLNLSKIDPDFYVGITHKWLCAPRGSAFMYARPELQHLIDPLIVSWGWKPKNPGPSKYVEYHEWQGSRDISAFLSVPAAIDYQKKNHWQLQRHRCGKLLTYALKQLSEQLGTETFHKLDQDYWRAQVSCLFLPQSICPEKLRETLRNDYKIDISSDTFLDRPRLRISVQAYNDIEDINHLAASLKEIFTLQRQTNKVTL